MNEQKSPRLQVSRWYNNLCSLKIGRWSLFGNSGWSRPGPDRSGDTGYLMLDAGYWMDILISKIVVRCSIFDRDRMKIPPAATAHSFPAYSINTIPQG